MDEPTAYFLSTPAHRFFFCASACWLLEQDMMLAYTGRGGESVLEARLAVGIDRSRDWTSKDSNPSTTDTAYLPPLNKPLRVRMTWCF